MRWRFLALFLSAGCAQSPLGPAAPRVDLLTYVLGPDGPRDGSQLQSQLSDLPNRRVCWVKYGRQTMFECWRWDEQWIYHEVDHGLDGNTGESYSFTDGRFLPRYLTGGTFQLSVPDNFIHWFTKGCEAVLGPEGIPMAYGPNRFPYAVSAMVAGNELVLTYLNEESYFRQGLGWYRWKSPRGDATFDHLAAAPVMALPAVACLPA